MKILLISSYLPYPLHSGGQVRLYNLIKELSARHEITLICEIRPHQTDQDITEVKKICKEVITVDRKKQWSVANILKAGTSSQSFLLTGHTTAQFKHTIHEALKKDKYDVIHVETYYVMQNLPMSFLRKQESLQNGTDPRMREDDTKKPPVVLVEHNIEYQVYEKFRDHSLSFFRPILSLDIAKIRKEEAFFWKKAKTVVAVSREDQAVMKKVGVDSILVPNGVNTDQFAYKPKSLKDLNVKKLLFIGDFTWIQNQDSVAFIIEKIWPKIKESGDLKLWIVGRKIPNSIKELTHDPDVLFDEKSSSLPTEKIFQEAAVLLAPIRVGGGTSYKILEAMSVGTPVVAMQMSADALHAIEGKELMVGKNAEELAEVSLQLVQNEALYAQISKNGRELVEKNYTWKEIGKQLEEAYHNAILNA